MESKRIRCEAPNNRENKIAGVSAGVGSVIGFLIASVGAKYITPHPDSLMGTIAKETPKVEKHTDREILLSLLEEVKYNKAAVKELLEERENRANETMREGVQQQKIRGKDLDNNVYW